MKGMFTVGLFVLLLAATTAKAQSLNGDRVYTGDQTSNTVSVIDPSTQKLLGVIRLGDPVPAALSPLYKGALLVHGLGFSPDHRTLAVISIGSNSVTLIDTTTNRIKGTIYVGRSPHEGFFTPNGRELWVAVRGEDYVSVIDPVKMKEVRRIKTANGPAMVLFRPDGRYAFVPSSFTPEFDVIDTASYEITIPLMALLSGSFCDGLIACGRQRLLFAPHRFSFQKGFQSRIRINGRRVVLH